MTIKKLTFCILCSVNAANLATDEDFNNENSSNSEVEEDSLITKNNWNTKKWGNLYFLFPHLSIYNIPYKCFNVCAKTNGDPQMYAASLFGPIKRKSLKFLNFLLSGVVEYKYMFHKRLGLNIRLNFNNIEVYYSVCTNTENKERHVDYISFFSLDISFEYIYRRKNKHVWSGGISPIGFAFIQKTNGETNKNKLKDMCTLDLLFLKYEYNNIFYMNLFKIKTIWFNLCNCFHYEFSALCLLGSLFSIEFGLNIVGVNDWRKKRKF